MSALGSKIIGSKSQPGRLVTVEITNEDGSKENVAIEVRSPSKVRLIQLGQEAGIEFGEDGSARGGDPEKFLALLQVETTFEPGTKRRVFSREQLEDVRLLGPEFDELRLAVFSLINPPKDVAGKSEQTPSFT